MNGAFILAIIFSGAILILTIIGGTLLMAIRLLKSGVSKKARSHEAEEARMIQEIYQGLSRMEERVENLEALLMEEEKKETEL